MKGLRFVQLSAAALAVSALLSSCGGGKVDKEDLVFIGSAGGDWLVDAQPSQPGLQQRDDCGASTDDDCFITIQPVGGPQLFNEDFDVTYSSNLPNCPGSGTGRVRGEQLTLNSCFAGRYVNINEARSDDGATRIFSSVTPPLAGGLWVEIEDERRHFKFSSNTTGCEISASGAPAVSVTLVPAQIQNPAGPFETTIGAFSIAGSSGVWTGRFVGVSGMHLVRGDDELLLERRADPNNAPCP